MDNRTLQVMREVCEALVYAEEPMTKKKLSEILPTQPNSGRIVTSLRLLQAVGIIARTSWRGVAKYRLKIRYPDELLPTPKNESSEVYLRELADVLRELADWVEESLPE